MQLKQILKEGCWRLIGYVEIPNCWLMSELYSHFLGPE